jgi:hypothetical protein
VEDEVELETEIEAEAGNYLPQMVVLTMNKMIKCHQTLKSRPYKEE